MATADMNCDEKKKGSLEVGKYADLVVLGEDIFSTDLDRVKDIPVSMTVVGGHIIHRTQPQ